MGFRQNSRTFQMLSPLGSFLAQVASLVISFQNLDSVSLVFFFTPKAFTGTSLVVQWLRVHGPNAEGLGSIPGQGTRSHML